MNSYNDNLHADVLASLQSQELDQKKKNAQQNAAMFSLYYAQGARITAADKLESAEADLKAKGAVKDQAVINSTISQNLLMAANQGKAYVSQSVTNASVGAANVQIASNAVLKLASDIGSAFSIISAADHGDPLHPEALQAYQLINQTAAAIEEVSNLAMEASSAAAQISAPTVAAKAKATNTAVNNILKVASEEFDKYSTAVNTDNATLAQTNTKEKEAEGVLVDLYTDYLASQTAYTRTNNQLNLGLQVTAISTQSFQVAFNLLKTPFANNSSEVGYPVQNYFLFVVKEQKKTTFNINSADRILRSNDGRFTPVTLTTNQPSGPNAGANPGKKTTVSPSQKVNMNLLSIKDTDGQKIEFGTNYVVFLMGVYYSDYKKDINNFEDYLSAPSAGFAITNQLIAPKPDTIAIKSGEFSFTMNGNDNKGMPVEYRGIFVPADPKIVGGLLTESGLNSIEAEVNKVENVNNKYDPQISDVYQNMNALQGKLASAQEAFDAAEPADKKAKGKARDGILKQIEIVKSLAQKLETEKQEALNVLTLETLFQPGIFFNLTLAEQVSAGNYIPGSDWQTSVLPLQKPSAKDKADDVPQTITYKATIGPETTDNFGNPLQTDQKYLPVVLATSSAPEHLANQYTSAVSVAGPKNIN
ncbi:MAG TPA: hypothetical protein PKW08_05230 [Flavobacteriaceae bacterium]|nr:hypothetical protein [Flavobacteriaceae bacterium]MCB9214037.1 hypothetical protein [Alteromonas sp.]HPF10818.1 hypothetical protein [Flavobacteriaceae bacterium]HQU20973.1 hypothetical protein [Flavobacteriaceae bacterium]HQU65538.1 hypothetical protein [Flavobacteriaceae bacterium]